MKCLLVAVGIAVSIVAAGIMTPGHAQTNERGFPVAKAAATVGECAPNKVSYRTDTTYASAPNQIDWVTIPRMQRVVTTTVKGCVIVEVDGEFGTALANNSIVLRAIRSGGVIGEPTARSLGPQAQGGVRLSHSVRFFFSNVPAGTHTFAVQWIVDDEMDTINVTTRTMSVQYR